VKTDRVFKIGEVSGGRLSGGSSHGTRVCKVGCGCRQEMIREKQRGTDLTQQLSSRAGELFVVALHETISS
jgi:hypothetical protein